AIGTHHLHSPGGFFGCVHVVRLLSELLRSAGGLLDVSGAEVRPRLQRPPAWPRRLLLPLGIWRRQLLRGTDWRQVLETPAYGVEPGVMESHHARNGPFEIAKYAARAACANGHLGGTLYACRDRAYGECLPTHRALTRHRRAHHGANPGQCRRWLVW